MSVFVVDASLVVKWFVPEVHAVAARKWLDATYHYIAPDLVFPEAGNAIWKKVRRGELSPRVAAALVSDLAAIGVETVSTQVLVRDAHALAVAADITVYDATYLALAVRLETQVITGDDRFARKLAARPTLAPHIRSVEDFIPQ